MKNIMFIAPPAAGKGTQAEIMVNKYHIPHISTGDILRDIAKEDSEMGNYVRETLASGELVKDSITYKLIEDRLSKDDCKNGYIIDGFPRNIDQAKEYDKILSNLGYDLGLVIILDIDKDILEKRITGRRVCENCKATYNINNPESCPKKESICDKCGGNLYQRDDDNLESFRVRYKNYEDKTKAIIEYYKDRDVIRKVDGTLSIDEVAKEIDEVINNE